jgi:hypothetical protein
VTNWQNIADKILARVLKEWRDQGHDLTKKVENTAKTTIKQLIDVVRIEGELEYYARFVNTGVPASKIPYSLPSGRGGTSKYIQGLIAYATKRGMDNPKSAAFAIAATHKKEGMPSKGSYSFSSTGSRTSFVEDAFKDILPELDILIAQESSKELTEKLDEIFIKIDNQKTTITI